MIDTALRALLSGVQAAVPPIDDEMDRALARLDGIISGLASALTVEYYGPEVGLGAGRSVYRMVVRRHRLGPSEEAWGLWVCTALSNARWRASWRIQDVSRLRKRRVIKALPAFFGGFLAAVRGAGKEETRAGLRLGEIAVVFTAADSSTTSDVGNV